MKLKIKKPKRKEPKQRVSWRFDPATRVVPSGKEYSREKEKQEMMKVKNEGY